MDPSEPNLAKPALVKEELLSLPSSESFERFIAKNATDIKTVWTGVNPIELDESRIPKAFSDALYFSDTSVISNIKAELSEQIYEEDSRWHFTMGFSVDGTFNYRIYMANYPESHSILHGEDYEGNSIDTRVDNQAVLEFLLGLYSRTANGETEAHRAQYGDIPISSQTMRSVLEALADMNGIIQSIANAHLPYPDGDKSGIVKLDKTRSPKSTKVDVDIDVGYEVDGQDFPIRRARILIEGLVPNLISALKKASDSTIPLTIEDYFMFRGNFDTTVSSENPSENPDPDPDAVEIDTPEFDRIAKICVHALIRCVGLNDIEQPDTRRSIDWTGTATLPKPAQEPAYEDVYDLGSDEPPKQE